MKVINIGSCPTSTSHLPSSSSHLLFFMVFFFSLSSEKWFCSLKVTRISLHIHIIYCFSLSFLKSSFKCNLSIRLMLIFDCFFFSSFQLYIHLKCLFVEFFFVSCVLFMKNSFSSIYILNESVTRENVRQFVILKSKLVSNEL